MSLVETEDERRQWTVMRYVGIVGLFLGLALAATCGGDSAQPSSTAQPTADARPPASNRPAAVETIAPADFKAPVDNPFFPLHSLDVMVLEGEERDPDTGEVIELRVESTVLPETDVLAGVEVTVVEVKDFENGELLESTRDYYAQRSDGTVYYLGERVDDYQGGQIVGHGGQWLAGEGGHLPGIFMPANPALADEFEQERAPGVAEDRSKVIAVDQTVKTPAGAFTGCIKTEDFDPLGDSTEYKYYCPDVGLIREEWGDGRTFIELTRIERASAVGQQPGRLTT